MNAKILKLGTSPLAVCLLTTQLLTFSTTVLAAKGNGGVIGGGGGDASEARVDEIRTDISKWIDGGGAKGLNFENLITYSEYTSKMTNILQPKKVIVTFVEKDSETDSELQVIVDGKPKTCRGFVSQKNESYNIICNIPRFLATKDSEQYKLIHHEYAGLAYIEKNEGAASDYFISNQLTDYLTVQTILRLSIKGNLKDTCPDTPVVLDEASLERNEMIVKGFAKLLDGTHKFLGIWETPNCGISSGEFAKILNQSFISTATTKLRNGDKCVISAPSFPPAALLSNEKYAERISTIVGKYCPATDNWAYGRTLYLLRKAE